MKTDARGFNSLFSVGGRKLLMAHRLVYSLSMWAVFSRESDKLAELHWGRLHVGYDFDQNQPLHIL
jgi:hypothetical protein